MARKLDLSGNLLPEVFPDGDPSEYALPVFLESPVDSYASRAQPAVLTCVVAHAVDSYFVCNEERMKSKTNEPTLDEETKLKARKLTVEIDREAVMDVLGKFTCQCVASSGKGVNASPEVTIRNASKFYVSHLKGNSCNPWI